MVFLAIIFKIIHAFMFVCILIKDENDLENFQFFQ